MFLCPDDPDTSADPYRSRAHQLPGQCRDAAPEPGRGSPDGTGRNDGVFWFQSAVRLSSITRRDSHHGTLQRAMPRHELMARREDRLLPEHHQPERLLDLEADARHPVRRASRALRAAVGRRLALLHAVQSHLPAQQGELPAGRHHRRRRLDRRHRLEPASRRGERGDGRWLGAFHQGWTSIPASGKAWGRSPEEISSRSAATIEPCRIHARLERA